VHLAPRAPVALVTVRSAESFRLWRPDLATLAEEASNLHLIQAPSRVPAHNERLAFTNAIVEHYDKLTWAIANHYLCPTG
jgi:hypothetical protein